MKQAMSYALMGMLIGAPLGVALGILTHNTVLGMAGPGIGLALGAALDAVRGKRKAPPEA